MTKTPQPKARQAKPASASATRPPKAGQEARDEEKAKAAFLAAFGHGPDYHARFAMEAGASPEVVGAITTHRANAAGLNPLKSGCGWWFCAAEADSVDWREMAKALDCLVKAGIDPHGPHVARLGSEHTRVRGWAVERDPYEVLEDSLLALRGKLSSTSDAERLRRKWLEELRPLRRNSLDAKPLGHGTSDEPRRAVIRLATPAGWQYAHVAAALVLTGAEKLTADRDFKTIKDELRKAFPRVSGL